MRVARAAVLGVLVLMVLVPAATAGVGPRWRPAQVLADPGGLGDVGIDAAGTTTAVWDSGSTGTWTATRARGGRGFGRPSRLGPPGSHGPKVSVADDGGAATIFTQDDLSDCDPQMGCMYGVRARLRPPGQKFGPVLTLTGSRVATHSVTTTQGGEAIAAWGSYGGDVRIAIAPLSGRFGRPELITRSAQDGSVFVGANDRGDTVAAWSEGPYGPGSKVVAAFRPAGGGFGPPRVIRRRTGENAQDSLISVAVDQRGRAMIAFSPSFGAAELATRSSGRWSTSALPGNRAPHLALNDHGDLLAYWSESPFPNTFPPKYDTFVSIRPEGGSFPAPRWVSSAPDVIAGFDRLRNVVLVGRGAYGETAAEQGLFATTISRFGAIERSSLTEELSNPLAFDVGRNGSVVVMYGGERHPPGEPYARPYLGIVTRDSDASDPRLLVRKQRTTPRRVSALVRCDEPCRVRLVADSRARRRGRAAAARSRLIPARSERRMTLRIGPRLRQRALRNRGRLTLRIRAEDAAGNRRVVKRKLRLRR